jgi:PHP family Zn ribbon phosphoesterase
MNVSEKELKEVAGEKMARVIILNREGKLKVKPGYDGVYGEVDLKGEENGRETEVGLKKYF